MVPVLMWPLGLPVGLILILLQLGIVHFYARRSDPGL